MKLSDDQIVRAMQLLQLTKDDFTSIERATSFVVGQQALEALKERAKKQFKKLAFELHPDRTNNDPAKTEDFKLISAAVDDLEKLQLRPPPPPRPVMPTIRIVFRSYGGGFTGTSTTTTTGGGWYGGGF